VTSPIQSPQESAERSDGTAKPTPSDIEVRAGEHWKVGLTSAWRDFFPARSFESYEAFETLAGESIKQEFRTSVRLVEREADGVRERFVLKVYLNPHVSGILTCRSASMAEQEFRNLATCAELDVKALEPVAFGERRGLGGMVKSCFVITRFVDNAMDVRGWMRERGEWWREETAPLAEILAELGVCLRRLHSSGFFLKTSNLRNILLHRSDVSGDVVKGKGASIELILLDLPEAGYVRAERRARQSQMKDLGAISGPILRRAPAAFLDPFYQAYLPDPLGDSNEGLRSAATRAAAIHNNTTPVSQFRRRLHRVWMALAKKVRP